MPGYRFIAGTVLAVILSGCSDVRKPAAGGPLPEQSVDELPADGETSTNATSFRPWRLVGKTFDDAEVKAFISQSNSTPERSEYKDYGVFICLHRDGVELSANTSGVIGNVILYASQSDEYDKYTGPLPRGLSWEMSRAEVEKIIGPPADHIFFRNSEKGWYEFYANYPELDLHLTYVAKSETHMQARLLDMRVKNREL
jgi:hypothetical protein